MITILIPEKIPAHNKGEEAILKGMLKTLEFIPEKKIYLVSKSPAYDKSQYKESVEIIENCLVPDPSDGIFKKIIHISKVVPSHIIYLISYKISKNLTKKLFNKGIWKIYNEVDIVLAAHDNAYSKMHNYMILFCKMIDKFTAIYGASIRSFLYKGILNRYITKYCLNIADLVTVREEVTQNILVKNLGINKDVIKLTADLAFLMDPLDKVSSIKLLEKYDIYYEKEPIIGMTIVNKTGILNQIKINIKNHINKLSQVVEFVSEKTMAKIVFFPHSIGPGDADNDRIAAQAIFDICRNKDNIILIEDDIPAAELKGMIGCCDFFIGERTHSIISAVSMLVPSVSISHRHDYRTIGILGKMLKMEKLIYDINEIDNIEKLKDFVLNAWNNREFIKNSLIRTVPNAINNAMKNEIYLKDALSFKKILGPKDRVNCTHPYI